MKNKEYKIRFKIESGTETFETPIIEGKLSAIIVDSQEKISFNIWSKLGYPIYHNREHEGVEYYAPRVTLEGNKRIHFDTSTFDKFQLNEPLDIRVDGPKNAEITMIIRLS